MPACPGRWGSSQTPRVTPALCWTVYEVPRTPCSVLPVGDLHGCTLPARTERWQSSGCCSTPAPSRHPHGPSWPLDPELTPVPGFVPFKLGADGALSDDPSFCLSSLAKITLAACRLVVAALASCRTVSVRQREGRYCTTCRARAHRHVSTVVEPWPATHHSPRGTVRSRAGASQGPTRAAVANRVISGPMPPQTPAACCSTQPCSQFLAASSPGQTWQAGCRISPHGFLLAASNPGRGVSEMPSLCRRDSGPFSQFPKLRQRGGRVKGQGGPARMDALGWSVQ